MRSYVVGTEEERREMLSSVGVKDFDALYVDIPEKLRFKGKLDLPEGKSELEVRRMFAAFAADTRKDLAIFRGAGAYDHYIPAAVPQLAARSEFYTAYTPYQPEMSQGMLQGIFEYQTLMCQLTGMDAANASVYDGATAAAEAMHMIADIKRKGKVLYSAALHPDTIAVIKTYARFSRKELVEIPVNANGTTDMEALSASMEGAAGYIVAQPNFFGCLDNIAAIAEAVHAAGGLLVTSVNPLSLGILARPGDMGADIAVGDGQPLGLPIAFGGPYVGFMACKQKLMRSLPGRISGETEDADGNRVYVLTLQAREQHIRREKASSNICSNQMLCAITNCIYLSLMGPEGLREAAMQSMQKAHYLAEGMGNIKGAKLRYPGTPFFNEFAVDYNKDASVVNAVLKNRGIMGGVRLSRFDAKDENGALWCATEKNAREDMDAALAAIEEVLSK